MDNKYRKTPLRLVTPRGEKKKQRKKAHLKLLQVLVFFLLLAALLSFLRSDYFKLDKVVVQGNMRAEGEDIVNALQIDKEANIWKVSLKSLREQAEALPRVEGAEISRRLPRTILVQVREKEPVALAPYGEHFLEICADGQIIGSTRELQGYDLPLLTGVSPLESAAGEYLLQGEYAKRLNKVAKSLKENSFEVSEINFADSENLVLVMMDGLLVWLGDKDFEEKIFLMVQIYERVPDEKKKSGYLDLRIKEAPAFGTFQHQ